MRLRLLPVVAVSLLLAAGCALASPAARPAPEDALASARARFATLDGHRVRYKSLGRGREALVFIHGWTCDLEFWKYQAGFFAGKTRVLAVDLPGHGGSDAPAAYSMDLFARAVEAAMRDAGVDRAVLVGHSMGTPVARQFYRLFPQKTLALVAVDGSFRPFATDPDSIEKFVAPYRTPAYREALARMIDYFLTPATPADMRDRIRRVMLATPQPVIVGAAEAMVDPAIWKDDPIQVPVLVVLAKSPFWTSDYEDYVRRLAARLEYRVLEGSGHFLMVDKAAEFDEILARFLSSQGLLLVSRP